MPEADSPTSNGTNSSPTSPTSAPRRPCSDERWTTDDCHSLLATLKGQSDTALIDHWLRTVGQWLTERDDHHPPTGCDYEDYLSVQLGKLIDGRETDYEFIVSVTVPETIET